MRDFRRKHSVGSVGEAAASSNVRGRERVAPEPPSPERKWMSQFHQGQWEGPFRQSVSMRHLSNPAYIPESQRFLKHLAPQRVAESVLCLSIKGKHTGVSEAVKESGAFYVEEERVRANKIVQEARQERRRRAEEKVRATCQEKEAKTEQDMGAALIGRTVRKLDYFARLQAEQEMSGKHAVRKLYVPMVHHAFHAPTKLFFTNFNQTFERRATNDSRID